MEMAIKTNEYLIDGGLWGSVGIVQLVTDAIFMCPLYSLQGINTCPAARRWKMEDGRWKMKDERWMLNQGQPKRAGSSHFGAISF